MFRFNAQVNGLLTIATLVTVSAVAQSQAAGSGTPSSSAVSKQAGRKLYERVGCYECHGHEGQGGSAGKRLAPHPIAYTDFASYCRRPTADMPPYTAKILSDADLASIYAFLQSIPEPPPAKTIPLLSPTSKKSSQ